MLAILRLLEMDLQIRNCLFPPLFTLVDNINSNLNMLHGLESLIPKFGTGTGNCDIQRKRTACKTIKTLIC